MNSKLPSNKKFGGLFFLIVSIIAIRDYFALGLSFNFVLLVLIASLFGLASILNSKILTPLNRAWFLLGQFLGKIVSPIVLGTIFFLLITPIGLIGKLFGRDELKLKKQLCETYWTDPVGSTSDSASFKNQF